ncbi:MAG: hypothetical protein KAV82_16390, partial [Phycisphaerae bacterium]|nr:hypothetical protein [Phycisphaerae bacterium]
MHWRVKRMAVVVAAASVAMVLGTTGAFAQYIPPGTDCLETTAGSTWVQFGGFSQVPPIPEDFFFPGSEPFEGVVALRGDPLPGYVGAVNTLLERQEGADVSMGPAIVQVQLVELKLVSVDPIVVLDNAVPPGEHLYNVEVTLNPNAGFESMGYMNIVATSASGGEFSFDSAQGGGIDIYARFNFFEAWPSKVTTRLEPFDPPNPLFLESYSPIPWQYEMPLLYCEPDQNFYPVPGYEALLPLDEGATGEHGTTPPREVVGCCLPSGECINIEYQECLYYGGTPQADFCYGYEEACCFEDGRCRMLDPLCCMDLGGQVAWGKVCSTFTMACCFDDGSFCMDTDPACCELAGGWPGFAQQCLGDLNGNNIDDACETTDECRPTPDGSGCMDVVCPNVNDICLPRCVNYDPDTGAVIVLECECRDPDECHVDLFGHAARGTPCEVPDNGTGTVTLPPMGCEYLSPNEVHKIIEGLPPGTEIELAATHKGFFCEQDGHMSVCTVSIPAGECEIPGGSLGGHVDCFESTLHLEVTGTGALIGYNRTLAVPVGCEVHTGPRNPGEPVQTFENIMSRLQGELLGDLDFCVLKITGGNDFGLPSPGHTTLTQLPSGDFAVDSFFDITYQIEFEGCPGSQLDGYAGITTDTVLRLTCHQPRTVDWGRLQWPLTIEDYPGTQVTVYGRVYVPGLTDQTPGVDPLPGLVLGQAGFGPGSDPFEQPAAWTWTDAVPNPAWDGIAAGEPDNDEYMATVTLPLAAGDYDYCYRFSGDGGTTWLYVDKDTGVPGEDGSENGYQTENAGKMTVYEVCCIEPDNGTGTID